MDKKAAIREYKLSTQPMGIYQIRNTRNDKVWLDSSVNLPAKFNRYRLQLNAGTHVNKALQADWKELGESSFVFEVLEPLEPRDDPNYEYASDLEVLEDLWLEKLMPYGDRGYNIPKKSIEERLQMIRENRRL